MSFVFNLLRRISKLTLGIVVVLLFVLNIAAQTFSGVSSVVSAIVSTVFGVATVSDSLRAEIKAKNADLDAKTAKVSHLETKNGKLAKELEVSKTAKVKAQLEIDDLRTKNARLSVDLDTSKSATAKVRAEADDLLKKSNVEVKWKGKKTSLKLAVKDMTGSVKAKTKKVAASNVSSMFGESIPYYGIAIIVASTAYELKTACDTMKEMDELMSQVDPESVDAADTIEVCGMKVPTKDEIIEMVKNSPEAAWDMAVNGYDGAVAMIPTWQQVKASPGVVWDGAVAAGAWTADATTAAAGWTADKAVDGWNWTSDTANAGGTAVYNWIAGE